MACVCGGEFFFKSRDITHGKGFAAVVLCSVAAPTMQTHAAWRTTRQTLKNVRARRGWHGNQCYVIEKSNILY